MVSRVGASTPDQVHWLKKLQGKYEKDKGIRAFFAGGDHLFIPEIEVDDKGIELELGTFINKIKVSSKSDSPAKVNFSRPITGTEYSVIHPGTGKVFGLFADSIFIQATKGHTCLVEIECLKVV